jgi:hypothetical protein
MQGEEGVTTYFDLEVMKNKKTRARDAFIDSSKITDRWADRLAKEIESVELSLKEQA